MFEDTLLDSALAKKSRLRHAAIPLACAGQSVLVGALILIPLFRTQAVPPFESKLWTPAPVFHGFTHTVGDLAKHRAPSPSRSIDPFEAPPRIPPAVRQISDDLQPPMADPTGPGQDRGAPRSGNFGPWIPGSVVLGHALAPPPVVPVSPMPERVRLSAPIVAAKAIYQPKPAYPHLALVTHTQGTVVLEAIIGKDGSIQDLKVVRGHPFLAAAALDAVRTWRYQPTLLNSEPVEVLTEIEVKFTFEE